MNRARLVKLTVDNFKRFSHVVLELENFTSISGKTMSKALVDLVDCFKFVFNIFDFDYNEVSMISNNDDTLSTTSVEAEIIDKAGKAMTFRKTLSRSPDLINFFVNNREVSESQYVVLLRQTGIILSNTNTLIIDLACVEYIATKTEKKLSSFIEFISTDRNLIEDYKNKTKIHDKAKNKLTATVKQYNEIVAEKKKMMKKIEVDEKRNELVDKLESELEMFKLFRHYHNEKLLEKVDQDIDAKMDELDTLKLDNNESIVQLREHQRRQKEAELEVADTLDRIETFCHEQQKSVAKYLVDFFNAQKLANDNKSAESLKNLIKYDKGLRKQVKEEAKQLTAIRRNNDDGETATSSLIELRVERDINENLDVDALLHSNDLVQILMDNKAVLGEYSASDNEIETLQQAIETLKGAKTEKLQEIEELKAQIHTHQEDSETLNKLTKSIDKFLQTSRIANDIVDELVSLFPGRVYGRLNATVVTENIRKLLGSFTKAIIVDSKRTADKCLDLLSLRQIQPTHETFLILDEIQESKPLAALLAAESVAEFQDAFITKFIATPEKDLQKALMFCVKPTLIANSLHEVDRLLSIEELKRLDLADTSTSCFFTKQGHIKVMASFDELIIVDETNLMESIQRESDMRLEQLRDGITCDVNKLRLIDRQHELADIEKPLYDAEKSLQVMMKIKNEIEFYLGRIAIIYEREPHMQQHFEAYEQRQNEFNEQNEALIKLSHEFRTADMKLEQLKSKEMSLRNEMNENARIADELFTEDLEAVNNSIEEQEADRDRVNEEYGQMLTNFEPQFQNVTEIIKQVANSTVQLGNNVNQIFHAYDDMLKNEHQKKSAINENYRSVRDKFKNWKKFEFARGSMLEFLTLPSPIPANFNLAENQLLTVKLNSNQLKTTLKNDDIDVPKKTIEFEEKLMKLQNEIDKPKRINVDVNESRLRQKNADLAELQTQKEAQAAQQRAIEAQLNALIAERRQKFLDCIATINQGIAEFCNHTLAGGLQGKLVPEECDEPYLSGLTFQWPTLENPESIVTERDFNNLAAFAMLWGIVKYKQQQFVILNDATMKIYENLEQFFNYQRQQVQVVSLTSKLSDDEAKYFVKSKAGTFVVKEL